MYGIFTYIWLIFMVNVGEYTIHGSLGKSRKASVLFIAFDGFDDIVAQSTPPETWRDLFVFREVTSQKGPLVSKLHFAW